MTLPLLFGAWMLYAVIGLAIARLHTWPAKGSLRYTASFAVPALLGVVVTVQDANPTYMVAGFIAAAMIFALLEKRGHEGRA